jgi:hypothetical protein
MSAYSLKPTPGSLLLGGFILLFQFTQLSGVVRQHDLQLWHTFDEVTDGVIKDATSNGLDGTLSTPDGPALVDGKFGKALSLDGTDDKVHFPTTSRFNTYKGSISVWVKTALTGEQLTDSMMIYYASAPVTSATSDGFGGDNEMHLNFRSDGKLEFFIQNDPQPGADAPKETKNIQLRSAKAYNDGEWHHVVATWDAGAKQYKIFVDGSADKVVQGIRVPRPFAASYSHLAGGPNNAGKRLLNGQIDDLRLYGSVLTEADANAILAGDQSSPFTSSSKAVIHAGKAFSHEVTLSVEPKLLEAEGLPEGLALDAASRIISGTPAKGGRFDVTLTATLQDDSLAKHTLHLLVADGETNKLHVANGGLVIDSNTGRIQHGVINIAGTGTISAGEQSSASYSAEHARDGIPGTISHSKDPKAANFIELDLEAPSKLHSIQILNRADGSGGRLNKTVLKLLGADRTEVHAFSAITGASNGELLTFVPPAEKDTAQFIRLEKEADDNHLHIAEIKVYKALEGALGDVEPLENEIIDGVRVLTFDSINLGKDVAIELMGDLPLSLRTLDGDITIATTLDASGGSGVQNNRSKALGRLGGAEGPEGRQWNKEIYLRGNGPGAGYSYQNAGTGASHGGLGGRMLQRTSNSFEKKNPVPSVHAPTYGDREVSKLLGGSSGGSSDKGGGGAGGGAIELTAGGAGKVTITESGTIRVDGGNATGENNPGVPGSGSGGSIRISGSEVHNNGVLSARGGVSVRGSFFAKPEGETRGGNGGGGRIAIHSEGAVFAGNVNVDAGGTRKPGMASLDNTHGGIAQQGTFAIIGNPSDIIDVTDGTLTIDTSSASWHHSGGFRGLGQLTEYTATMEGRDWKFKVATFELSSIRIDKNVQVILTGVHSLSLKTVDGGNIRIDADLIANGGNGASDIPNYSAGGRGILGGYNGGPRDPHNLGGDPVPSLHHGEGPGYGSDGQYGGGGGGSGGRGGQGRGANGGERGTDYADPLIGHLLGGSGGGAGDKASGAAGGGAIEIASAGSLTLGGNIEVNGGNSAKLDQMGGAGAGGSIKLSGTDVTIKGSLQANGGNINRGGNTDRRAGAGGGGRIHIEHSGKLDIQPGAGGPNGLVAHYTFSEGSGRQTVDHVSKLPANFSDDIKEANAWKTLGGLGFSPARAVELDGYKDYVTGRTASEYGVGGATQRTFACWVKARSFGHRRGVFHIGKFGTKNQDFSLCTNSTDHGWVLQLWSNDKGFYVANSKDVWIHFAVTYDGTDAKVYANGTEVATEAAALNTPDDDALTIGAWQRGTNQHLEYFDGMIRDFRIYNRALIQSEVQAVMGSSGNLATIAGSDSRYGDAENGTIVVVPKGGPSIEIVGEGTTTHEAGEAYPDPGARALDSTGTEIAGAQVNAIGAPDGKSLGEYIITYTFNDEEGRAAASAKRIVNVVDTTGPTISLVGSDTVQVLNGAVYLDPGATAIDNLDTDIDPFIVNSSPALPTDGLVLRYTFDDPDNPLTDDISNKVLTPQGDVALTADDAGFIGKGLNFTGADGSFAEIEAFESGGDMSVTGHVFLRKFNNWQRIFSLNDGAKGKNGIYLAQIANDSRLRWRTTPGSNIDVNLWETEKWVHFVVSTGANDLKTIYKDGTIIHSRTDTGGDKATRQNNWLGKSSWDTNGYLDGILDNFMVYNRGLSAQEAYSLSKGKSSVDTSTPGEYTVSYDVIDQNANQAQQVTRKVVVVDQLTNPQLTLNGENPINVEAGTAFTDPGATAKNPADDSILKADVSGAGSVDTQTPGQYILAYSFTEAQLGEALPVTRTVVVSDTNAPILSMEGDAEITINQGQAFSDPGAKVTDSFDTEVVAVSSALPIRNALNVKGFNKRAGDAELDLSSPDGILSWTPDGSSILREGPRNNGLEIGGGADFRALNAGITEDTQFSTLVSGIFQAKVDGEYSFGITGEDDRGTFWLDLDQDGKFELVGDNGGEHMNGGLAVGFSSTFMKAGFYRFSVGQTQNTGWSMIQAVFMAPEGAGPQIMANIQPADPGQDGIWWTEATSPIDVNTPGEYTATYTASDASGNEAQSITRKVTVVADTEPPVITLTGGASINHQLGAVFVDPGVTANDNVDGEVGSRSSLGFPSVGLMGHWTFDDGTPSDRSGNRRNGTNFGTPVYDAADIPTPLATLGGKSVNFTDGNHAIVIDTGGSQDVFNLPSITVSLWAKGLTGNNASFISKEGENNRGWQIRRNGTTKNIESVWRVAGHDHTSTGDIMDDGQWHHIAASWDGRVRTVYIDGQINVQSTAVGSIVESNRLLVIGGKDNGGYGQPTASWYNGQMDDVAIYNRALRPEEVSAIASGAAGLNINTAGTYTITYTATDKAGNTSTTERTVIVADDPNKPVITLIGDNPINMEIGSTLTDPGVTVTDATGTLLDASTVKVTRDILTDRTGENTIYYDYIDAQGRPAKTVSRAINIVDATPPSITFNDRLPVTLDQDIADNVPYSQSWDDGSDGGGNGFNPWKLTTNANGGAAGFFIGDSKIGSGDINTNGKSFGLYGNSNAAAAANADRTFATPLAEGQTFSIQIAVNYRNGSKGIDLDKADGTAIWNLNIGKNPGTAQDDYSYADLVNGGQSVSLGLDYQPDSVFTVSVTQKAGTKVGISISRTSAAKGVEKPVRDVEFDLGAGIAGFGLYVAGTEGGDANNLYTNNLSLTSPPTGDDKLEVFVGSPFTDPGATANDNSGDILHVSSSGSYPAGLIGRWTFDKENLDDLSPYGHNAVLVGGTYSDDTPTLLGSGKSMDLSQGNHYITINDASPAGNVFDSPNISVAFWVKDAKRETNWEAFITKRGEGDAGWQVRYNGETNRLSWTTCIIGGNVNYAPTNGINIEDNQWRHVAVVYDGKQKIIYLDGVVRGLVNTSGPIQPAPSNKLVIGARDTGPITRHSKSIIDEVAIWNRGLNPEEIPGVMVGGTSVDTSMTGEYSITYSSIDSSGNLALKTRVVEVIPNPSAPVISLNGPAEITHEAGGTYQDAGATLKAGDGSPLDATMIEIKGIPKDNLPGTHVITYNYEDGQGNVALEKKRIVNVVDTIAPAITLNGNDLLVIEKGTAYTEPGFSATDMVDGNNASIKSSYVTPDLIPAAAFHVHADSLSALNDGDAVGSWEDTSTGGNKIDVKATGNKRPSYVASFAPLNSKPAVLFDNKMLKGDISGAEDIMGQHVFVVASRNDTDTSGWRYLVAQDKDQRAIRAQNGKWHNGGNWNNFRAVNGNPAGQLRFNGTTVAGNNNTALPAENNGFVVHSKNSRDVNFTNIVVGNWDDKLGRGWKGHIAEIIIHGPLTNQEINAVGHALVTKYALTETNYTDPLSVVDTSTAGDYTIIYTATDMAGNNATGTRTIRVVDDASQPILTLNGAASITLEVGTDYEDLGATVTAGIGGAVLNDKVTSTDALDKNRLGAQNLAYNFTDGDGNIAQAVNRTITYVDTTPPVITLVGDATLNITTTQGYTELGVTITDNHTADPLLSDSRTPIPNQLHFHGWQMEPQASFFDFNNNGGLAGLNPDGSALFTNGPGNRGMDYNANGEFRNTNPGITLTNRYTSLFNGEFKAKADGPYEFGIKESKAFAVFWLDLDQDGVFKTDGEKGNERLNTDTGAGSRVVDLTAGVYKVAIAHGNVTGAPSLEAHFRTPAGAGPEALAIIKPTDALQNGLWSTPAPAPFDGKTAGEYTITYTAEDASGNTATASRKVIVIGDVTPPVITLVGEAVITVTLGTQYDDEGATAEDDTDGVLTPFIDDSGSVDAVDTSKVGEYTITYDVSDQAGNKAVQVTRKIIVQESGPADNYSSWISGNGLAALSADKQALDADPDNDGLANLLEYALGKDPVAVDALGITPDTSSGSLSITFVRVKASIDATLTYKIELATTLSDWAEANVTINSALQGVDQTELPDGNDFATSKYERVTATAKTDIAGSSGKQFLRMTVEK